MKESVQIPDVIVWWVFCPLRHGFQSFFPANVRCNKKYETLSSLRLNGVCPDGL
ncbi:hypothetical protein CSQ41_001748 [Salmonella enterica subsp. arizonae]|nr:hypothetical protein [Salmonella enterica subsp. arizonae]